MLERPPLPPLDPRKEEKAKVYRDMARYHAGLSEAHKTLQKWAEEEAVMPR